MKTLAIAFASWIATVRTFQDGDVYRESSIDLQIADVCDRLGYLKTTLDGKGGLADNNEWNGQNEFKDQVTVTDSDLVVSGGALQAGAAEFGGTVEFQDLALFSGGVELAVQAGADAATPIANN